MAERSIYAQIDELNDVLEKRRQLHQRMRGHSASEETEHLLRLECVLKTLEWVRHHQEALRALAKEKR
ncbi:hypothetical protein [uncultured Roseibium sp.]|uniref:hypothetical protein n=1 Tax=uncultured Roseibium sp. TaxID=1936171 RepID=UPI00262981C5|nr:hypothetical protein [uncultured Roseibium sp.]